jgi:transcriptional regulator with XRE-family HTH domain
MARLPDHFPGRIHRYWGAMRNPIFVSLDRLRRAEGISQREYCEVCMMPRSQYALCLKGEAEPTVSQFRRMVAYHPGLLAEVDQAVIAAIEARIPPCWRG